jgi:glycosyltransferase A (GT-A) superfamily protein (DUF2064 family)
VSDPRLGTVLVIAKEPVAGRVKTRLVPDVSYEQAADLAAAALADTLEALAPVPARRHVLAFAGCPDGWATAPWTSIPQAAGGLDARLTAAFLAVAAPGRSRRELPAVLVGMDTPQVRAAQLTCFDPTRFDACLGLADDGGFWALGFRQPSRAAEVIPGVTMSAPCTGHEQWERLRSAGMRVQLLDTVADVDTIEVAREVATQAPHTRFARMLASLDTGAPAGSSDYASDARTA